MGVYIKQAAPEFLRARIYNYIADGPEVLVMGSLLAGVISGASYTLYRSYSPMESVFMKPETRADMWKQVERMPDTEAPRNKSIWHSLAQFHVDKDGRQIGIFHNRMRPFEYDRSAGLPTNDPQVQSALTRP
jgi:hypothetical protein